MKKYIYPIVFSSFFSIAIASPQDDLMVAVRRDSDIAVKQLLRQGVNVNARDQNGKTALTVAIHEKSDKVLPLLLNWKGTDINATNQADESPLMIAIISNQTELARQLIARGAVTNKAGWSPLHYAATRANVEIMQLLLEKDAYIDAFAPDDTTPLMMAAQYGDERAVRFLLDQGADVWARNQRGMTAMDFARLGQLQPTIELIKAAQARRKDPGKVLPLTPLSAASAAELKGEPIPENPEPVPMIYPEGQEPPEPPASAASGPAH